MVRGYNLRFKTTSTFLFNANKFFIEFIGVSYVDIHESGIVCTIINI